MNKLNLDKSKILVIIIYIVLVIVCYQLQFGCIYQNFFGVRCPGCGMTRAIISAMKLDFKAAFTHHSMFWSMPVLGLYYLCDGSPFKSKMINRLIFAMIMLGFIVNWIIRLCID